MSERIIFLDRDGTINRRPAPRQYLRSPAEIEYLPRVKENLKKLAEADFHFIVVTNQAGIGLGLVTLEEVETVNRAMNNDLESAGIPVIGWYICPHREEDKCLCRKPKSGLMLSAAKDLGLAIPECWNVGDSPRDILMGISAGCTRNILVRSGYDPRSEELASIAGTPIAKTMADVVNLILKSEDVL